MLPTDAEQPHVLRSGNTGTQSLQDVQAAHSTESARVSV